MQNNHNNTLKRKTFDISFVRPCRNVVQLTIAIDHLMSQKKKTCKYNKVSLSSNF